MLTAGQEARYCRLTVLTPHTRVDVALPTDIPVAELVPMVLELVGEPVFGLAPEPWLLSGGAGGPLPPDATLGQLGVPDGELLRLAPESAPPAPPVFDDPVDALAATAGSAGADGSHLGPGTALLTGGVAAVLLATGPADTWIVRTVVAAVAAGAAVGVAARFAAQSSTGRAHRGARAAALVALPLAAAAGWAALPGSAPAAQLLLAAAAAAVTAAAAQIVLRVVSPVLIAVVVAAIPVGLGAVAMLRTGGTAGAVGAAVAAFMLVVGPLLPRVALQLSGLPRPVVPADSTELVGADTAVDLLPPAELAERADLARGYLAGLVGGTGAVAAAAVLPAAAAGGWAGPALGCVVVAVLALRARGFADTVPARTLATCAVLGLVGLAAVGAARVEPWAGLLAAAVLLVVAVLALLTSGREGPAGSPVSRRAIDVIDGVLVAAAVPLALAAMDLFRLVRGL